MNVTQNLKTIQFYLIKLATDFYQQPSYLLDERDSLCSERLYGKPLQLHIEC
jgi:hypothetical protein